jgi:aspartyl-tRNA(Asn)/glutamyl-tRNA(Gln) amidotransferase subunit C
MVSRAAAVQAGPSSEPARSAAAVALSTNTLSVDDVADLARLARIELTQGELAHLAPQLDAILEAVATVSEVAAEDIPPTSHPLPLENVSRADEVRPSLPREVVLAGAPAAEDDRFRVPRILEEEA